MDKISATWLYFAFSEGEETTAQRKEQEEVYDEEVVETVKYIVAELQAEVIIGFKDEDLTTLAMKFHYFVKEKDDGKTIRHWEKNNGIPNVENAIAILTQLEMQVIAKMAPTSEALAHICQSDYNKDKNTKGTVQPTEIIGSEAHLRVIQREIQGLRHNLGCEIDTRLEAQEQLNATLVAHETSQAELRTTISNLNTIIDTHHKELESLRTAQKRMQDRHKNTVDQLRARLGELGSSL